MLRTDTFKSLLLSHAPPDFSHKTVFLATMKIPLLEWLECNKGNAVVQSIGEWPGMKVAVLFRGPACSHQGARTRGVYSQRGVYSTSSIHSM